EGTLEDILASGTVVTFMGFANLTGNAGTDRFNFEDGDEITGTINGGDGSDTLDYSAWMTGVTVDSGNLVSIETLIGGMSITDDVIVGGTSGTNFVVSGPNAGTAQNVGSPDVVGFTDFENLSGGNGDDSFTFNVGGSLASAVDGGTGANSLTFNDPAGNDDVTLTDVGSMVGYQGMAAITDFDNITSLDAGTGNNNLFGLDDVDIASTWTVETKGLYSTIASGSVVELKFANFDKVIGGAGADSFILMEDLDIVMDGGAGTDSISFTNSTVLIKIVDLNFGFSGQIGINASFDDIEGFFGTSGTNTLEREDINSPLPATWVLNSTTGNAYTEGARTLTFSGMKNLIGTTVVDTFNVTGSHLVNVTSDGGDDVFNFFDYTSGSQTLVSAITGTIDAGETNETTGDTLSYSTVTQDVTVDLATFARLATMTTPATPATFEIVIGGNANDTLIGDGSNNAFAITGAGSGTVDLDTDATADVTFSNFETLQGAAGVDSFTFSNGATIKQIDGGAGNDSINLSAYATPRNVELTGLASNGFSGMETGAAPAVGIFNGITSLMLPAGTGDSLKGLDTDGVWVLSAAPTYTNSSRVFVFTGADSVTGGSARDTFNVSGAVTFDVNAGDGNDQIVLGDGAVLTGNFDGGLGFDTVDLSAYSMPATFAVTDKGSLFGLELDIDGISGVSDNIDTLVGGMGTDTLVGLDQNASWSIGTTDATLDQYFVQFVDGTTGANFGRTLWATSIETRTGGNGDDTFTVRVDRLAANSTHSINGGLGNDRYLLEFEAGQELAASSNLVINGGAPTPVGGATPVENTHDTDQVEIHVDQLGDGPRTIGLTYDSGASGDVSVTGLGGAAPIDINTVEVIEVIGDSSNNDKVTVTGTAGDDVITVAPVANGGRVYLGGATDFTNPGIAGGSTGPDIVISGVANTEGISIDAGATGADTLLYDGSPTITPTGAGAGILTAPGVADITYSGFETVAASGTLSYTGSATTADDTAPDTFSVTFVGGDLVLTINGVEVLRQNPATIDQLVLNGSSDDDSLTIDYTNGNPIPSGGLTFNGGGQTSATGDSL
ncbi:MAG: hypothetical protein O3B13_25700, partial [Planctomycetota bacterium]|nr:hypothetical protein [Planctomycetota bacterium]